MSAFHTQTVLADPERGDGHDANGVAGDCLRACVASMFDVENAESVPNFAQEEGHYRWYVNLREWAREQGWDFAPVDLTFPVYPDRTSEGPTRYAIATGPSPRGSFLHSVLVDSNTGDVVHDPHPSRAGLAGDIVDVLAVVEPYEMDSLLDYLQSAEANE